MFNNRPPTRDAQYQGNPRQANKGARPPVSEQPKDVAKALRVKNFRLLLEEIGEENLAVRLGLSIPRIRQMQDGFNFSDEMAYHVESELRLPSGLIDRVNPSLTDEELARLRAALVEERHEEQEPAPQLSRPSPVEASAKPKPQSAILSVVVPHPRPGPQTAVLAQAEQQKNIEFEAEPASASSQVPAVPVVTVKKTRLTRPQIIEKKEPSMLEVQPLPTQPATSPKPALDESQLREVRRQNFIVLTSRPGAKKSLAELTGLSAANVSHRLHGNKIFDEGTADFFCEKLGLPLGWFESAKEDKDIPEETLFHLTGVGGAAAAAPKTVRKAASTNKTSTSKTQPVKRGAPSKTSGIPSGLALAHPVPPIARPVAVVKAKEPAPVVASAPVSEVKPASPPVQVKAQATAPVLAPAPLPVVTANIAAKAAAGSSAAQAVRFSPEGEVGQIAQALLFTLAAKSRSGQLSEDKALQMLVDAASM
jgi:hypothetical protein